MPSGVSETLGTIATVAMIASAAASISAMAYNATKPAPETPDLASSSKAVAEATAGQLPINRALAAAEQQGAGPIGTAQEMSLKEAQQIVKDLQKEFSKSKDPALKAQINSIKDQIKTATITKDAMGRQTGTVTLYTDQNGTYIPKDVATADFTGMGTADIEGELANQRAETSLALGEKYGTKFAEEAKREAELADPMGTKAREMEYNLIQDSINKPPPINPMAGKLESDIAAQVNAGSGFDPMSRQLLDEAVSQAAATRGGGPASGDVAGTLSTGASGEARRQAAMTAGQAFASSGTAPGDVQWRRNQQNLANLGAFVGGQSPVSQFKSLSGAGQGATPFYPGQPMPNQGAGTGTEGGAYSVSAYNAEAKNAASQANPWMAGLSTLMTSLGTVGKSLPAK